MKSRYTITIADMQMNVLTEESEQSVTELVNTIDRRIREINTRSRHCSKTEAALLCALDYCADKFKAQRRQKVLEAQLAVARAEIADLKGQLEALAAPAIAPAPSAEAEPPAEKETPAE